jgi:hypothetical protein
VALFFLPELGLLQPFFVAGKTTGCAAEKGGAGQCDQNCFFFGKTPITFNNSLDIYLALLIFFSKTYYYLNNLRFAEYSPI